MDVGGEIRNAQIYTSGRSRYKGSAPQIFISSCFYYWYVALTVDVYARPDTGINRDCFGASLGRAIAKFSRYMGDLHIGFGDPLLQ